MMMGGWVDGGDLGVQVPVLGVSTFLSDAIQMTEEKW